MKKRDVQHIVTKHIEGIKTKLALDNWLIIMEYGLAMLDGDDTHYPGMCNTDPSLPETALITIDPKLHNKPAEVIDTLRHELAHCISSGFNVCQAVLAVLLTKREYKAVDVLFRIAHEQTVANIQQILRASAV